MAAQDAFLPLRRHRLARLPGARGVLQLPGRLLLAVVRGLARDPLTLLWLTWIAGGFGIYALLAWGHP